MTNEQLLEDLKQYIDTRLSTVATKSDITALDDRMGKLESKIDVLDEKLDTITEAVGESFQLARTRLDDHDGRIGRLERRAA